MRMRILLSLALLTALAFPSAAQAACSNPAGVEGEIIMNSSFNVPAYCDDTNWIVMKGGNETAGSQPGNGLVAHWRFDETTSVATTADSVGSNDGTFYGGMNPASDSVAGRFGTAFDFDGTDDEIEIPPNAAFNDIFAGGGSISFWVYPRSNNNGTFIYKTTNSGTLPEGHTFGFLPYTSGGRLFFRQAWSGGRHEWRTEDAVNFNQWNHIVVVFDNSADTNVPTIYVNNVAVAIELYYDIGAGGAAPSEAAVTLWVGWEVDGYMDDIRYYDRELTPADVAQIYNATTADSGSGASGLTEIVPSGLVGHWRFDETTGTTAYDSSTTGVDLTYSGSLNPAAHSFYGKAGRAIDAYYNDTYRGSVGSNSVPLSIKQSDQITMAAWVKIAADNTGVEGVIRLPGLAEWNIKFSDIRFLFEPRGWTTSQIAWGPTIPQDEWTHIAVSYDYNLAPNTTPVWFVNGAQQSSMGWVTSTPTGPFNPTSNTSISIAASNYPGAIDDVRIYDRILNEDEVRQIYNARDGIRYNESQKVYEYFDGNKFVSMKRQWREPNIYPDGYIPNGVDFDGSTYVRATSIGGSNVTQVSGSFWFKRNTANLGVSQTIAHYRNAAGQYFRIRFNTSNRLVFDGQEAGTGSFTTVLNSSSAYTDGNWHHVLFSLDSTNRSLDNLYIDGVNQTSSTGATIPAFGAGTEMSVGMFGTSNEPLFGGLADFWIDFGNRIDFSVQANRDDFINAQGNAVFLGTDGSIPTGSAPEVFLSGETSSWQTNKGSFSGFTENGTLTESSKKPYRTGGLIGHWKLEETSGTTAVDSSGNGNNATIGPNLDPTTDSIKGAVGTALHLKNKDPSVNNSGFNSVIDTPDLLTETDNVTLAAWVYPERTANTAYMRLFRGSSGWFAIINSNNTLSYTLSGSPALISSAVFENGKWIHLTLTYDATSKEQKIFVNGTEDVSQTDPSTTFTTFLSGISHTFNGYEGGLDDVRLYNRILNVSEIQQLYQMGAPVGSSSALPQGCPNIGDMCDDGTYYAGLSPDGNIPMYAAAEDEGVAQWRSFGNSRPTNNTDGDGNTALLYAFGPVEHPHAYNCFDKVAHGASDWYWPAQNEMLNIYNGGNPIGGVIADGSEYWTSNQHDSNSARSIRFNTGYIANTGKNGNFRTRCVRKGPAPRCANPYGLEGQIIYNSTHDVVQFCDGARWIAVGK